MHLDKTRSSPKKPAVVDYDSEIDPDDLLPVYLECKTKLFHLQASQSRKNAPRTTARMDPSKSKTSTDPESAKLLGKVKKIEDDVLFDQYVANQQWEAKRIQLERESAAHRNVAADTVQENSDSQSQDSLKLVDSDDEVSREAAKIGAAMLEENESDDEGALADLFASLPVNEVDPVTGKTSTVVKGSNGVKVTIRDFGKWTGVTPTRVLEEACRARFVLLLNYLVLVLTPFLRDTSVKLYFNLISDSTFSNRHSLRIVWSKAQDFVALDAVPEIDFISSPKSQTFTMKSVSSPDSKQSEAFVATTALFLLFSSSTKEDKVFLRLPAAWRDLWTEFSERKKEMSDEADRNAIRVFRDMVREKRDQELEDGVLIQGAFRNRIPTRVVDNSDESGPDKSLKSSLNSEAYRKIWADKSTTPNYQMMLVSRLLLTDLLSTN
jgi:ATP-dependent RNA helicase DHX29